MYSDLVVESSKKHQHNVEAPHRVWFNCFMERMTRRIRNFYSRETRKPTTTQHGIKKEDHLIGGFPSVLSSFSRRWINW